MPASELPVSRNRVVVGGVQMGMGSPV